MLTTILILGLFQAPLPDAPTPPNEKAKKVCRYEKETGSRLGGQRRCQTVAEWEQEGRMNRSRLDQQRDYSRQTSR